MTKCAIYLISPAHITLASFGAELEEALATTKIRSFQLRLKEVSDSDILAASSIAAPVCRKYDVAFILNDRVDLVTECHADGVHLGQEDMNAAEARAILGKDAVIGVSCHASKHLAMEAAEAGADYVAFGAFYPTLSKPMEKIMKWGMPEPSILEDWSTFTTIPCIAIGGITPENCAPLVRSGADFIAVITAVWRHPQGIAAGVEALAQAIEKAA